MIKQLTLGRLIGEMMTDAYDRRYQMLRNIYLFLFCFQEQVRKYGLY